MTNSDDKPTLSLAGPVKIKAKRSKGPRKINPSLYHDPKKGRTPSADKRHAKGRGKTASTYKPISLSYVPNLPANRMAAYEVAALVLLQDHYLDKALSENKRLAGLYASDRQFVRLLVTSLLRHHRQLSALLSTYLQRTPPADAMLILMMGAAQLLLVKTPIHAALSTSVDLMRAAGFDHMTGMANAVLRKISQAKIDLHSPDALALNIEPQILESWQKAYGKDRVDAFLPTLFTTPKIDLSFADAAQAKKMSQQLADKQSALSITDLNLRMSLGGNVTEWPGFEDGHWWVQDIAATMPAHLLGNLEGKRVIDMCAAPGGKTAQLIAQNAKVTALELDPKRARRLTQNLTRLKMSCVIEVTDALHYEPDGKFDAVLLDAPCSATGTIRKRPDVMRKDISDDLEILPDMQKQLAKRALSWLTKDGVLVYATCSLQPEEGEDIITSLTTGKTPIAKIIPITPEEAGPFATSLTSSGCLRLLPDGYKAPSGENRDTTDREGYDGNDGFFIARLQRI